jgi:hypothetical protein
MIKLFFVIIPALIIFIASPFMSNDEKVTVTQNYISTVKPGEELVIKLTIKKNNLTGVGRLQQYLPAGFTAEIIDPHGAEFTFKDQSVKFTWIQLPAENEFTVAYKIKTDKNATGRQALNGVFVYIDDGKTVRQPLPTAEITVTNSVLTQTKEVVPEVNRKVTKINETQGEYRVELIIKPNTIKESAQFSDEIPQGFIVEVEETNSAIYKFENNTASFSWNRLPDVPEFRISYIIKSGKPGPSPVINGVLVFGDENQKNENVTPKEILVTEEKTEPVQNTIIVDNTTKAPEPVQPVQEEKTENTVTANANIPAYPTITGPANGIWFKVQISATQKSSIKNDSWFNSKYHLSSPVELTEHQGWKKYLIGNFAAYQEAKEMRIQTQQKISDAFVVAYQNGTRIPVSEAIRHKSLNQ